MTISSEWMSLIDLTKAAPQEEKNPEKRAKATPRNAFNFRPIFLSLHTLMISRKYVFKSRESFKQLVTSRYNYQYNKM